MPNDYSRDFAAIFGFRFSLETTVEYAVGCQGIFGERGAKYAQNKAREVEKICSIMNESLIREINKKLTAEEKSIIAKAVTDQRNLIDDFFYLEEEKHQAVREFMKGINQ